MNSIKYTKAIKEVNEYLKGIRKEDYNKIPEEIIIFLKENQAEDYECRLDYMLPFKDMKLMEETKGIILYLCYNYWCENENEKQELFNKLNENERKFQEQLKEQFKGYESFNKTNEKILPVEKVENIKNKTSFFSKIFDFIKKITKKN